MTALKKYNQVYRLDITEEEHAIIGLGDIEVKYVNTSEKQTLEIVVKKLNSSIEYESDEAVRLANEMIFNDEANSATIYKVSKLACKACNDLPYHLLKSKSRTHDIVFARYLVMIYATDNLKYSYTRAANLFGKDHSTINHAKSKFENIKFLTGNDLSFYLNFKNLIKTL